MMTFRLGRALIGGIVLSLPAAALLLILVLAESLSIALAGLIYGALLLGTGCIAYMAVTATEDLDNFLDDRPLHIFLSWLDFGRAFTRARQGAAAEHRLLRDHLADHQSLIDHLPDPVLVLNQQRQVVETNPAGEALLGQKKSGSESLTAMNLSAILRHPDVVAAIEACFLDPAMTTRTQTAEIFLAPQDRYFSVRVQKLPPSSRHGPRVLVTLYETSALKRSDKLRRDFIANASHELRTPLAAVEGFIETLQGPARDDPQAREKFLSIMAEQAARMSRLIRDLLSLSRIEMEEHDLPHGKIDLRPLLTRLIDGLPQSPAAKPLKIELILPPDLPPVRGDADQLAQLFLNLIDNARRYAADSPLTISAAADPSLVSVRLVDHGPGIAPEHLPRLTERFYRVPAANRSGDGGTGLGLAIVKHIIGRHRGQLTIDSALGKGTEVTVKLPRLPEGIHHNLS